MEMGRIRAFLEDDIPRVAELYWRFLQGQKGPHPLSLEKYFQEVFFYSPWFDGSITSLVYEEHGRVVGFLGIVPRPMSVNGKLIQAVFGSSHVVDPENRSSLAGLNLLAAFFKGKPDLALTDTANQLTQQIWVAMGGRTSAVYGLRWARPVRPSLYGLHALSRFGSGGVFGLCGRACGILSKAIGAVSTRIPTWRLRRPPVGITEGELEIDALLHSCLPGSFADYSLRPEYTQESLRWLLDFMSRMKAHGNLRKVALHDVTKRPIGWFIYYVKRGGIAEVVQIEAGKGRFKTVLDYLFFDARNRGAIALHGKLEIRHVQELSEARCFFWGTTPLLFRARDPELARAVQHGECFLSRLDGEWCLRYAPSGHEHTNVALDFASGEQSDSEATKGPNSPTCCSGTTGGRKVSEVLQNDPGPDAPHATGRGSGCVSSGDAS
jgi:hypothetical protein